MRFKTKAIHEGSGADPLTGAVSVPVYMTSTYAQERPGITKGYEYSRTGNPTRKALEEAIASLEECRYGTAYSSGMGAITTLLLTLKSGDEIIATSDLYGGTYRLFEKVFANFNIKTTYVDSLDDLQKIKISKNLKLLWMETPSNPLLKIYDIKAFADIAHEHDAMLVVDNTFATPYFQQPVKYGADVIVHSTTKYISGHSDVIGGAVCTDNEELDQKIRFMQNAAGAICSPMDAFLTLRGLKTLAIRMEAHQGNSMAIAHLLSTYNNVKKIYYPGTVSSPYWDVVKEQMSGYGGMVSFELKGDASVVEKFLSKLEIFQIAESLGGIESLVEVPAVMTHASIPKKIRESRGITDTLIRLSCGIEDTKDLLEDIRRGLESC
ncbi:MAG: PLP-dependent aspartate aminotransferase family protein [Candidatus Thermoplasmatota archaeon]|nr:PLP-dependent aspartate aminotransferase family protein [Candidatus Thermoplasmatota archaeon]MCL5963904.1 PLP-dependent aspartate aminotransferase family protein [Candidatus Thermoplasmatota archaeon]